jgi:hypothetical protein
MGAPAWVAPSESITSVALGWAPDGSGFWGRPGRLAAGAATRGRNGRGCRTIRRRYGRSGERSRHRCPARPRRGRARRAPRPRPARAPLPHRVPARRACAGAHRSVRPSARYRAASFSAMLPASVSPRRPIRIRSTPSASLPGEARRAAAGGAVRHSARRASARCGRPRSHRSLRCRSRPTPRRRFRAPRTSRASRAHVRCAGSCDVAFRMGGTRPFPRRRAFRPPPPPARPPRRRPVPERLQPPRQRPASQPARPPRWRRSARRPGCTRPAPTTGAERAATTPCRSAMPGSSPGSRGSSRCPGSRAPSVRSPSCAAIRPSRAYAAGLSYEPSMITSTARPSEWLEFRVQVTTGPGRERPCSNRKFWRAWWRSVSTTSTRCPCSSRMRSITRSTRTRSSGCTSSMSRSTRLGSTPADACTARARAVATRLRIDVASALTDGTARVLGIALRSRRRSRSLGGTRRASARRSVRGPALCPAAWVASAARPRGAPRTRAARALPRDVPAWAAGRGSAVRVAGSGSCDMITARSVRCAARRG